MKLKWNPEVKQQLEDIFRYNQTLFGTKKSKAIIQSIKTHILLLKQFPQLGPVEQNTLSRTAPYRYIVEKHCKIYYTIEPEYVYIAIIWDTRQDPEKLRKFLK